MSVISELPSPVVPSGPGSPFLVINTSSKSYCFYYCSKSYITTFRASGPHTLPWLPQWWWHPLQHPQSQWRLLWLLQKAAPDSSDFPIMARRTVPDSSEFPFTARRAIPDPLKFTLMARRAVSDSSDFLFTARGTVPELFELPAHSIMARSSIVELFVLPSNSIMTTEAICAWSVTASGATPGFVWFLVSALWWSSTLPWCHTLPCWSSGLPLTADPQRSSVQTWRSPAQLAQPESLPLPVTPGVLLLSHGGLRFCQLLAVVVSWSWVVFATTPVGGHLIL